MHMADALVSPSVAMTMYAASAVVAAYSIKKVREENNPRKIPLMGIMGALFSLPKCSILPFLAPAPAVIYAAACC